MSNVAVVVGRFMSGVLISADLVDPGDSVAPEKAGESATRMKME